MSTPIKSEDISKQISHFELMTDQFVLHTAKLNSELLVNDLISKKVKANWQKTLDSSIRIWTELVNLGKNYTDSKLALSSIDACSRSALEARLEKAYQSLFDENAVKIRESISLRLHTWAKILGPGFAVTAQPIPVQTLGEQNLNCLKANAKAALSLMIRNSGKIALVALGAFAIGKTDEGFEMITSLTSNALSLASSIQELGSEYAPTIGKETLQFAAQGIALAAGTVFGMRKLFQICCLKPENI